MPLCLYKHLDVLRFKIDFTVAHVPQESFLSLLVWYVIDAEFQNVFPICVPICVSEKWCMQLHLQIIQSFIYAFPSCVQVFRSCVCNVNPDQQRKGFLISSSILKSCTVLPAEGFIGALKTISWFANQTVKL